MNLQFWELFLIGIGLSMDALAVSICKGLATGSAKPRHMAITGLYFGGFQAFMPLIGYLLGTRFESLITHIDHWVAFVLLALIGVNMIRESREKEEEELNASFGFKTMLPLAVATSIDALAVGITFAFLHVQIFTAIAIIGCTTFALSALGVLVGSLFGTKYKSVSELVGGVILVLIGIKILLEHLGLWF